MGLDGNLSIDVSREPNRVVPGLGGELDLVGVPLLKIFASPEEILL